MLVAQVLFGVVVEFISYSECLVIYIGGGCVLSEV